MDSYGNAVTALCFDVRNKAAVNESIESLGDKTVDVLINNAGVAWTGDLLSMTLKTWQWIIQLNLTSIYKKNPSQARGNLIREL